MSIHEQGVKMDQLQTLETYSNPRVKSIPELYPVLRMTFQIRASVSIQPQCRYPCGRIRTTLATAHLN